MCERVRIITILLWSWEARRTRARWLCCSLWLSEVTVGNGSRSCDWLVLLYFRISVSKIMYGLTVYFSFIWLSAFVSLSMWNLSRLFNILPLLLIRKITIIFSRGPTDYLLSNELICKFWFTVPIFIFKEMFLESYTEGCSCLSDIFLVTIYVPHLWKFWLVKTLPVVLIK